MNSILLLSQLIIAFGIYNVWILRPNKATAWRGGEAKTMEEEFLVYGLSKDVMNKVRVAKLLSATAVLIGIWYPLSARVGGLCMALLMLAAVLMHAKVHDPIKKSLPAATMLIMSLYVALTR
jgi:hypothetical protein